MTLDHQWLAKLNHLEDALLLRVDVSKYQSVVELVLDYAYSLSPRPPDSSTPRLVRVRLEGVDELHIRNDRPDNKEGDDDAMNWSHNEISMVRLDSADLPRKHDGLHWMSLLWETERRIDIAFRSLAVEMI